MYIFSFYTSINVFVSVLTKIQKQFRTNYLQSRLKCYSPQTKSVKAHNKNAYIFWLS